MSNIKAQKFSVAEACQPIQALLAKQPKQWAVSSAVEHHIDIVVVTGSIPVPPTIFLILMVCCEAVSFVSIK